MISKGETRPPPNFIKSSIIYPPKRCKFKFLWNLGEAQNQEDGVKIFEIAYKNSKTWFQVFAKQM